MDLERGPPARDPTNSRKGGKMTSILNRRMVIAMAALLGAMGLYAALASNALAATQRAGDNSPAPSCKAGYHVAVQDGKAVCAKDEPKPAAPACTTVPGQATICSQETSTVNVTIKYNYIGTWDEAKYPLKKMHGRPACFWDYGTWTNSVKTPIVQSYQETSRAKFCWLAHPVTVNGVTYTAMKVAGGKTGSPCKNLAIPPGHKQPAPQIVGPVLDVRSLSNVRIPVNINATANANVSANWNCPGGTLSGSAYGMGAINGRMLFTINQRLLLADHGRTNGSVKDFIKQQIQAQVESNAKANAIAKITISCGSAPPPQVCTTPGATNIGGALPCQFPPSPQPTQFGYIVISKTANYAVCPSFTISGVMTLMVCSGTSSSPVKVATGTYTVSESCPSAPNSNTAWQCPGAQTVTVNANATSNVSFNNTLVCINGTTGTPPNCSAPPPVQHWTQVSCTGPQEISGGGSVIVKCDVSDDNGAQISLNAQSQDSNSQVTGINCYSQGGSPSCSGNGQFEFRVNGFNSTSGILTTTVKVYATANGVNSNTVTMTFNVDPSSGGFGG